LDFLNFFCSDPSLFFSVALLTSPVVNVAESLMFFPGTSSNFFCVDAQSGGREWTDTQGGSVILAEPKLAAEDSVVYVIESTTGNVRQHDASSGSRNWEYSCADIPGSDSCQAGYEAEFRYVLVVGFTGFGCCIEYIIAYQNRYFLS
jgi:outer membrane protein assembly factor BamB